MTAGPKNDTPNEVWEITPAQGHQDGYYIKSFCGLTLDVCEGKAQNGQAVLQFAFHGGKNQIFVIKPV